MIWSPNANTDILLRLRASAPPTKLTTAAAAEIERLRDALAAVDAVKADLTGEIERLTEELAETRAREHVLVIVGDKLSRHLEWVIEEPTSWLVPEVLDAIKGRSTQDVEHWLNTLKTFGFKRPDQEGG